MLAFKDFTIYFLCLTSKNWAHSTNKLFQLIRQASLTVNFLKEKKSPMQKIITWFKLNITLTTDLEIISCKFILQIFSTKDKTQSTCVALLLFSYVLSISPYLVSLNYFFGQIKLLRTPFSPVQIILEDSPGGQTTHNDTSAYLIHSILALLVVWSHIMSEVIPVLVSGS